MLDHSHQPDKAGAVLQYVEKTFVGDRFYAQGDDGDKSEIAEGSESKFDIQRFLMHQLKARLNVLRRSMKACKREIKSALNIRHQSPTALFLKGNLEYVRRNYHKAIKLLNSCPKDLRYISGQSFPVLYFNNLGCIHFQMGKYTLACFYFNKAIEANELEAGRAKSLADLTEKIPRSLVGDRLAELLYNKGATFLHRKLPRQAYMCFESSLHLFSNNPRAYLRMAECCIQDHANNEQAMEQMVSGAGAALTSVGTAQNRKLILRRKPNRISSSQPDGTLSLRRAISYLQNVLLILKDAETESVPEDGRKPADGDSTSDILPGESPPWNATVSPVYATDIATLRGHALCNLAYAYLGEGSYFDAVRVSTELLAEKERPGALRYLAHVYAAEALIRLERYNDAAEHLTPKNVGDLNSISTAVPVVDDLCEAEPLPAVGSGHTFTEANARATLALNLASANCIKGDFEQAKACLSAAGELDHGTALARQLGLLSAYLSLREGDANAALHILTTTRV